MLKRRVPPNVVRGIRRRVGETEPGGSIALTENELFEILADSRRREVIARAAGLELDGSLVCDDLARDIAARETHLTVDRVPDERIESVEVELRETHLPMLESAGLVRWDSSDGEIKPGHSVGPISEWVQAVSEKIDPIPPQHGSSWSAIRPSSTRR